MIFAVLDRQLIQR